jgi:hypothetical protein
MFDYRSTYHNGAECPTTSSLVRLKRTRRGADIEVDWNNDDDEENDGEPAATSSLKSAGAQLDPMREVLACRENIAELKRGYREGLYMELGRVTLIAGGFDRDRKSWARFVGNSFWAKARTQDRPQVGSEKRSKIAFVTRFVFKARARRKLQLTSKYSGVLAFLIGDGVEPEHIAKELKRRGGIEKIHQLVTKKPRPNGRNVETGWTDVVERRSGNDRSRSSNTTRHPIIRWDKKTSRTLENLTAGSRVRVDCKVIEPKDGRIRLSVVGITERR